MGNETDGEGVARLLDFTNLLGEERMEGGREGGREGEREGGRKRWKEKKREGEGKIWRYEEKEGGRKCVERWGGGRDRGGEGMEE